MSLCADRIAFSGVELEEGEDIEVLIEPATEAGIDAVELWWPRNFQEGREVIRRRLADARLAVHCLSGGIELYRDSGSDIQQGALMELLEIAEDLGAPWINTFFGFSAIRDDERACEGYARWVEPCVKRAEKLGVGLLIENEFNAFGWDPAASDVTRRPAMFRRLLDRLNSPAVGTAFDPANYVCAGVDPRSALREMAPYVRYVHVKDVYPLPHPAAQCARQWRKFTDFNRAYATCPLGKGVVPWRELLRSMDEQDFAGYFCMEPHATRRHRAEAWLHAAHIFSGWTDAFQNMRSED